VGRGADRARPRTARLASRTVSPPPPASFAAAIVEHLVWGRARSRLLEDVRADQPWHVDFVDGRLSIGKSIYKVNILGTYASDDGSFLWGWENPAAGDWAASLDRLGPLRALGKKPGFEVLGQRMVWSEDADVNELALVCGELAGGYPVFVGVHDDGAVILLMTDLNLDPATLSPVCYAGVFLDVGGMTRAPLRACVERFVRRAGCAVEEKAEGLTIVRRDASLLIEFDHLGRLGGVSGELRPG